MTGSTAGSASSAASSAAPSAILPSERSDSHDQPHAYARMHQSSCEFHAHHTHDAVDVAHFIQTPPKRRSHDLITHSVASTAQETPTHADKGRRQKRRGRGRTVLRRCRPVPVETEHDKKCRPPPRLCPHGHLTLGCLGWGLVGQACRATRPPPPRSCRHTQTGPPSDTQQQKN